MDYRKINSHVILLLMVAVVGLTIAVIGRLIALDNGFDIGTANLTFVIILGICLIIYLIILATLTHVVIPWIMKIFLQRNKPITIIIERNVSEDKIKILEKVNQSRQNFEKQQIAELNEKINLFLTYSRLSIALLVSDNEFLQLEKYIECYARRLPLPDNCIPIKTKTQNNNDLMRFGWNMTNFFKYEKQNVVPWLQGVFAEMQELDFSYIKGKLKHKTKNQVISITEDIPTYLKEQNQ